MTRLIACFVCGCLGFTTAIASAQPPQGPPGGGRPGGGPPGFGNRAAMTDNPTAFIQRLLTLDADKDGKLNQAEVKDERLLSLFKQLDADGDGSATRQEMQTYYAKEFAAMKNAPRMGGGPGGPRPGRQGPGGQGQGRTPGGRPNGTRPMPQ